MKITQGELAQLFPTSYRVECEEYKNGNPTKIYITEVVGANYGPRNIEAVAAQVWRYNNLYDRVRQAYRDVMGDVKWWTRPFTAIGKYMDALMQNNIDPEFHHVPLDRSKIITIPGDRILHPGDTIYVTLHSFNMLTRGMHALKIKSSSLHIHEGVGRITYTLENPVDVEGTLPSIQWDEEKEWYSSNYAYWEIHLDREKAVAACERMIAEDKAKIEKQMEIN